MTNPWLLPIIAAASVLAIPTSTSSQDAPAPASPAPTIAEYVVGPRDVLAITCYDQSDLSGKFTIDEDGTFTYPFIGRFKAGSLTVRQVEASLKARLKDEGFFRNPQITISVEEYRSQRVFVVGEIRSPGTYSLSGPIDLIEVVARAGSRLPTASSEAVIVHGGDRAEGPTMPGREGASNVERVNLHDLENGVLRQVMLLRDGDTVFIPRAETMYVFGQVRSPGAYALQQQTTVLQALSLAGGITDRGALTRIQIIRIVGGERRELHAKLSDLVLPDDTIVVRERFF